MQVCRGNPGEKGKYIKIILALLQSTSTAVVYECAVTLVGLSQAPTAIRAAANCYCQLLVSQSDNNVKLIVLDRLQVRALLLSNYCCCQRLSAYAAFAGCCLCFCCMGVLYGSPLCVGPGMDVAELAGSNGSMHA